MFSCPSFSAFFSPTHCPEQQYCITAFYKLKRLLGVLSSFYFSRGCKTTLFFLYIFMAFHAQRVSVIVSVVCLFIHFSSFLRGFLSFCVLVVSPPFVTVLFFLPTIAWLVLCFFFLAGRRVRSAYIFKSVDCTETLNSLFLSGCCYFCLCLVFFFFFFFFPPLSLWWER